MGLGVTLALLQTVSWAGASIVLRRLSAEHDARLLNGLRSLIALPIVLILVWVLGQQGGWVSLDERSLLFIVAASVAGGLIGDGLYIAVLNMIGVGRTLPITNSYPIVTMLLSAVFLDEKITLLRVAGIVLVLVGATLVARLGRAERASVKPVERKRLVLGVSLAALIAVLWAASAVTLSIGLRSTPPLVVSSIRLAVVAMGSLAAVAARGKLHEAAVFRGALLGRLALSSLLGSIGSATLFVLAIALIGPSRVTTINAAVPLFGAIMGYVFLRERLSPQIWVGTLLTVAGLVLAVL